MLNNVFLKSLRDSKNVLLYWSIGIFLLAIYIMFVISEIPLDQFQSIINSLPDSLGQFIAGSGGLDLSTVEGFLNAQIFTIMAPLIVIGIAVSSSSKASAAEENIKSLDIILSTPISRRRFLLEKILSMTTKVIFICAIHWLSYVLATLIFGLEISYSKLAAICIQLGLMSVTFGLISVLVGTLTGNPSKSIGIASIIGIASYLIANIAPLVDSIEFTKFFSLFHYYKSSNPLANGFHEWHWSIFIITSLILILLSLRFFERRDLL
jgi:ABC-2 type transport system permease protein